ncbi:MAG TPA: M20/M25/M40 family metallo-hydrolase [Chitinophagaceae bacterium]|nr:M20/M25/M40 family metallo-hydrolase [Chitinophagaceae bacterium]
MHLKRAFCFCLCLLITVLCWAQRLSAVEKNIIKNIDRNLPQTIALLEQLVNINSGTLNVEGVKKTGLILGKEFEKIGFTSEWITLPDSLKRAGHLAVMKKGNKGKKLLLLGHLDTVFEPDMPPNPYKKLNDSTATGQGVLDMKGGNVIILAALQALHEAGLLKNASITAYFTGDEEKAGTPTSVSRADFIQRAQQHDIALGFETAQSLETVATGRRGSSGWQLHVTGVQAHSAGVFNNNYGAIYEAGRILNSFREQLSNEKYLTLNPGIIAGGSDVQYDSTTVRADVQGKTNIIAPRVVVQGDLRFLTEEQKEAAREKMRMIATTNNLPATSARISFVDGIPGMEPTEGNNKLVQLLNKVSVDMGLGETKAGDPGSRGAGDISYIAKYLDCLDGLGPMGSGSHAPGEIINLKELPLLIHRAAIFIYRLTR